MMPPSEDERRTSVQLIAGRDVKYTVDRKRRETDLKGKRLEERGKACVGVKSERPRLGMEGMMREERRLKAQ